MPMSPAGMGEEIVSAITLRPTRTRVVERPAGILCRAMGRSRRKARAAALGCALVASLAFAQAAKNPYLGPAQRLYQSLEFSQALRTIEKGLQWPNNSPEEEVL